MMKKLLLCLPIVFSLTTVSFSQSTSLKGNGEVFYSTTFDWGNPDDPKGWTAPEGFYFEDPDDLGFNWHWWPGTDSLIAEWTFEPPLQSTSQSDGFLCNFLNIYNNWIPLGDQTPVNNAVVFPTFDCSAHSSVVVRYQNHFMNYSSGGEQYLMVSNDDGAHWAYYDVSYGCKHKDRPEDKAPGVPVYTEVNITDVAAGLPSVIIKFLWRGTSMYFWEIDDFELAEAYNNDLRIKEFTVEWDNEDPDNPMSSFFMIPKSQLNGNGGFFNWQGVALNFGEFDQEDVKMDLTITKNNQVIWEKSTDPLFVLPLLETDTARIEDKFVPAEFGHYKVTYDFTQSQEENTPENNTEEFFFHVTDSVYSRSDDTPELAWAYLYERYDTEALANEDFFTGSIFPIWGECEVNSVSVYIMGGKADGLIEFQFQLYLIPVGEEDETPIKWLTSDIMTLDSSMFNTWVTLPFEKDGESEFLQTGDLVWAGISQWNWNEEWLVRRNTGLKIGADRSIKLVGPSAAGLYNGNIETGITSFVGRRNLMCRININDHSNISDGVDVKTALSTLGQNYPNPFSESTEISYELANHGDVTIEVMDLTGRKVLEMNEGQRAAGTHTAVLNASGLESGVYFYTLRAGSFTETKRMVVK